MNSKYLYKDFARIYRTLHYCLKTEEQNLGFWDSHYFCQSNWCKLIFLNQSLSIHNFMYFLKKIRKISIEVTVEFLNMNKKVCLHWFWYVKFEVFPMFEIRIVEAFGRRKLLENSRYFRPKKFSKNKKSICSWKFIINLGFDWTAWICTSAQLMTWIIIRFVVCAVFIVLGMSGFLKIAVETLPKRWIQEIPHMVEIVQQNSAKAFRKAKTDHKL